MDQKKEYVAPKMDVLEYVVQTSLLVNSPDSSKIPTAHDIEFD